jgi:hypothetical protein
MDTDLNQVIVTTGATAHTAEVHHRDFPEVRAEGETPEAAASHLVNQLVKALDAAPPWRRKAFEQAIADIRAFAHRGP